MPQYTVESCESHDYLETCFSNESGRVSQYQWMSRYMQGSNDSIPPRCKECIHLNTVHNDSNVRGEYVRAGNTKSRMVKMLPQGLSHQSTSEYKNIIRSGLNGVDLTIFSRQSTESIETENGFTDNSMMQQDAYLHTKDAILQERHLPKFSINHNTASALNPKKVTVYGQNSSRLSETRQSHGKMTLASSHAIGFAAEDNHFEGQKMTRMALGGNKFAKTKNLHTCENNVVDSTSLPVNGKFKSQVPNSTLSEFPEEKGMPSSTDNVHTRNAAADGLGNFKHEHCNIWGSSSFRTSKMEDNSTVSNLKRSWSQKHNDRSIGTLGDSCVGGYTLSPLVGENDKHTLNCTMSRMIPHGHSFCSSVNDYPHGSQPLDKTTNCSIHNVESLRMNSTSNSMENRSGKSQNISNSFLYWLTTEGMSKGLPHREKLHARSIDSGGTKTTALYEMLTVPTTSDCHSKQYRDVQCNSSSYGYGDCDNWNDAHKVETKNGLSLKSAIMSMNFFQKRISPEGIIYTMQDKDRFTSDTEDEVLNMDLHHPKSGEAYHIRHKEGTGPKAESINGDWIFYNSQIAHESNSGSVRDSLFQVEPCNGCLKRLGHSPCKPLLSMKRPRIANDQSCDITFSKTVNCKKSNSLENVTEQRIGDKNLQSDAEKLSDVSEKEMQFWIGRWSHKGTQQPSAEQCSPEHSELKGSEEKQFPSIAAMALMAKVMNRSQRCEFQKRGSSTVWKTEGL